MIHLDSSFLIDLHRETARGLAGGALGWIEAADDREILAVSAFVVCELRAGAELAKHPLKEQETLDRLLGGLLVVYPDDRFAPQYARLLAALRRSRTSVSAMDLLIATAATLDDAPLLTRNVRDFARIPGLRLIRY